VLLLGVTYFCLVIGLYGMGFWMPQVIKTFGLSNLEVGLLAAIPYFIAAVGMVLAGRHSDKTGERIWHVAIPLFLGAIAFVWSASAGPLPLVMLALSLAALGIHAALGTFWSLPSAILTGVGAAGGLALVNSIGNCGGFVGPLVVGWLKGATGTFSPALVFLAGALLLSGLLALAFGRVACTSLGAGEQIKA
jgi:ACS family tartrate transporter-like MFS transporter